ncbi:MAG: hypothetical protein AB7O86_02965 [Porticoccaceae bacterium]
MELLLRLVPVQEDVLGIHIQNQFGWRLAVGGWRLAVGGWRLAVGGWRLAVGDAMRCDAMRCDAMRCDAMRCDELIDRHLIERNKIAAPDGVSRSEIPMHYLETRISATFSASRLIR